MRALGPIFALYCISSILSVTQVWGQRLEWLQQSYDSDADSGRPVSADSLGNVFLSSPPSKYDANGNVKWTRPQLSVVALNTPKPVVRGRSAVSARLVMDSSGRIRTAFLPRIAACFMAARRRKAQPHDSLD